MGAFDYKSYSTERTVDLTDLTHALSTYGVLKSTLGLPIGDILEVLGVVTNDPVDLSLPSGWHDINPLSIGVPPFMVDADTYIKMVSPVTGITYSGPQLTLVEQKNVAGQVTGLGVVFLGTNSPVDILDYSLLNAGVMHLAMEPVLSLLRAYAENLGLDGSDVIVTGYSLGGAYTNIMGRFADTLAGGFFADSDFVAHESPVIYDEGNRVLNIGYENDTVFRAGGNYDSFIEALVNTDSFLSNADLNYEHSTNNMILFDSSYAAAEITQIIDSALNLTGSWAAHFSGIEADALARVGNSSFYEFTDHDSLIVVSDLKTSLRDKVWVEDKISPTSNHYGDPAFIIGTVHADLLGDGSGNDWLDGGAGNDLIRVSDGYNRVDGGIGYDTLRLNGRAEDYSAYRLSDGALALVNANGVTLANGIEDVEFTYRDPLGVIKVTADYSIRSNRLEDDRWSLFELRDRDVVFGSKVEGNARANILSGQVVFAQDGNDRVNGTSGRDLLIGGEGQDTLKGGAGADRLYGGEHADRLIGDSNGDMLNGGHGDDVFLFVRPASGMITVEDFNAAAGEGDRLNVVGANVDTLLATARTVGDDLLLYRGNLTIRLEDTDRSDLDVNDFIIA
ncbi:MAG: calcium-binding protein [Paracoccus sp. (in: a-proteobacteria)]